MEQSKFIEIAITQRFASQVLKISMPTIKTQTQAFNWVKNIYEPKLVKHLKHVESIVEKYVGLKDKIKELLVLFALSILPSTCCN